MSDHREKEMERKFQRVSWRADFEPLQLFGQDGKAFLDYSGDKTETVSKEATVRVKRKIMSAKEDSIPSEEEEYLGIVEENSEQLEEREKCDEIVEKKSMFRPKMDDPFSNDDILPSANARESKSRSIPVLHFRRARMAAPVPKPQTAHSENSFKFASTPVLQPQAGPPPAMFGMMSSEIKAAPQAMSMPGMMSAREGAALHGGLPPAIPMFGMMSSEINVLPQARPWSSREARQAGPPPAMPRSSMMSSVTGAVLQAGQPPATDIFCMEGAAPQQEQYASSIRSFSRSMNVSSKSIPQQKAMGAPFGYSKGGLDTLEDKSDMLESRQKQSMPVSWRAVSEPLQKSGVDKDIPKRVDRYPRDDYSRSTASAPPPPPPSGVPLGAPPPPPSSFGSTLTGFMARGPPPPPPPIGAQLACCIAPAPSMSSRGVPPGGRAAPTLPPAPPPPLPHGILLAGFEAPALSPTGPPPPPESHDRLRDRSYLTSSFSSGKQSSSEETFMTSTRGNLLSQITIGAILKEKETHSLPKRATALSAKWTPTPEVSTEAPVISKSITKGLALEGDLHMYGIGVQIPSVIKDDQSGLQLGDLGRVIKLQNKTGFWEMSEELQRLLGVDFSVCRSVLDSAGLKSLGMKCYEDILRLVCTSVVLLCIYKLLLTFCTTGELDILSQEWDFLEKAVTKVLDPSSWRALETIGNRGSLASSLDLACIFCCSVDRKYPLVCKMLELASSWSEFAGKVLHFDADEMSKVDKNLTAWKTERTGQLVIV